MIETIIEHEQNARLLLLQRKPVALLDPNRAWLWHPLHAHSISSKEALNQLSVIKLGIDLGLFRNRIACQSMKLFIETQPAHLQTGARDTKNVGGGKGCLARHLDSRQTERAFPSRIRARLR